MNRLCCWGSIERQRFFRSIHAIRKARRSQ
jgi:hypothetical protein